MTSKKPLPTEYTIASSLGPSGLEAQVNRLMAEGWRLFGPPIAQGGMTLLQAMVRYPNRGLTPPPPDTDPGTD